MMTREDVLRELELLPAWQLRVPAQVSQTLSLTVESPVLPEQESIASKAAEQQTFTHIASEDGDLLFVLSSSALLEAESQLLHNIFKAMRIAAKPAETHAHTAEIIASMQVKCIITMGEAVAQRVLQTNESLEILRGQLHTSAGVKLVPTYDVKHLLQNLPDKAKTWHDLCIAMQVLQDLKMQD